MSKKVLIFGASGWLGRITLNFIKKNNLDFETTLVSSTRRTVQYKNNVFNFLSPVDMQKISNEYFDYYLNYAFLTQDKLKIFNEKEYSDVVDKIIKVNENFSLKNNLKNSLLISSGAVYWKNTNKENLYTIKKLEQEESFKQNNQNYLIGRLFAVIGSQFDFSSNYAFTSFINSAIKNNQVKIESAKKVIRSYLYFENFLELYFKENFKNQTLDLWDKVFDIYEIGKMVSEIYGVKLIVNPQYDKSKNVDKYISKNNEYQLNFGRDINLEVIKKTILEKNIFKSF